MLRVLHLAGSATDEFTAELSLLYARDCLEATADPARYEFRAAYVDPAGSWRFGADFEPETLHAAPRTDWPQALQHLHDLNADVVVPQMFCLPGMTTYRAALELAGLPYLGNRPPVMSLGPTGARPGRGRGGGGRCAGGRGLASRPAAHAATTGRGQARRR